MIRDDATAKSVLDSMNEAHALLMDSLKLVEKTCSGEEYKKFRLGMAHVLGRLFFLLMEPIYREHPSLAPPDTPQEFLDDWQKSSPSKTISRRRTKGTKKGTKRQKGKVNGRLNRSDRISTVFSAEWCSAAITAITHHRNWTE
jgi:hypothetical protein